MLSLELAKCGAEAPSTPRCWIAVNEAAELAHGPAWIVEVMLVEIYQGQSNAELVSTGERVGPQSIELDGRAARVLKGAGEQR